MALDPISAIFDGITTVVNKIWPDATQAQKDALALELAQLQASTDLAKGQLAINQAEASNSNLFVSGWRPAIGWTCACALFVYYVPYCLAAVFIWAHQCWVANALVARPDLGITDLIGLVSTMLGFGGLRTFEKYKGVTK